MSIGTGTYVGSERGEDGRGNVGRKRLVLRICMYWNTVGNLVHARSSSMIISGRLCMLPSSNSLSIEYHVHTLLRTPNGGDYGMALKAILPGEVEQAWVWDEDLK